MELRVSVNYCGIGIQHHESENCQRQEENHLPGEDHKKERDIIPEILNKVDVSIY